MAADPQDKVLSILAQLRPYLEAEGGAVTFDRIEDGVVHLALRPPQNGCASTMVFYKLSVERRIMQEDLGLTQVVIDAGLPPVGER
jgi:Fe-S cluster biogenesis protein NfuA